MLNHDMKIKLTYKNGQVLVERWGNLNYVLPKYEKAPQSTLDHAKALALSLIDAGEADVSDEIVFFTPSYDDVNYSKIVIISNNFISRELNPSPDYRVKFTYSNGDITAERWGYGGYVQSSLDCLPKSAITRVQQKTLELIETGKMSMTDLACFYVSDYHDENYTRIELLNSKQ